MAAVNADYSFLGEVANRERFREYDYGPGLGFGAELYLGRRGRPLFATSYRYSYIRVENGSIWNPDEPIEVELPEGTEDIVLEGSNANHHVHRLGIRLLIPFGDTWGIGADARLFFRDSQYGDPRLKDRTQRVPEARVFLTWDFGYTKRRIREAQRAAAAGE